MYSGRVIDDQKLGGGGNVKIMIVDKTRVWSRWYDATEDENPGRSGSNV